jgi:hypothetical protein
MTEWIECRFEFILNVVDVYVGWEVNVRWMDEWMASEGLSEVGGDFCDIVKLVAVITKSDGQEK